MKRFDAGIVIGAAYAEFDQGGIEKICHRSTSICQQVDYARAKTKPQPIATVSLLSGKIKKGLMVLFLKRIIF
jgi:hypothetical protein